MNYFILFSLVAAAIFVLGGQSAFYKGLKRFAICLVISSLAFAILQYKLISENDSGTLDTVFEIEVKIQKCQHFIEFFSSFSAIALIVVLLASCLGILHFENSKMTAPLRLVSSVFEKLLYFTSILSSFTLFGAGSENDSQEKIRELIANQVSIHENNEQLVLKVRRQVESKLAQMVLSLPDVKATLTHLQKSYSKYKNVVPFIPGQNASIKERYWGSVPLLTYNQTDKDKRGSDDIVNSISAMSDTQSSLYRTNAALSVLESVPGEVDPFDDYSEIVRQTVKLSADNPIKRIMTGMLGAVGVRFPLLEQLIDPINEKVEAFISTKVLSITRDLFVKTSDEISDELNSIPNDFVKRVPINYEQLAQSKNASVGECNNLEEDLGRILSDPEIDYLVRISQNDAWEEYRNILNTEPGKFFPGVKVEEEDFVKMKNKFFSDWDDFKQKNLSDWYQGKYDLEYGFMEFLNSGEDTKKRFERVTSWALLGFLGKSASPASMELRSINNPFQFLKNYGFSSGITNITSVYNLQMDERLNVLCENCRVSDAEAEQEKMDPEIRNFRESQKRKQEYNRRMIDPAHIEYRRPEYRIP